MSSLREKMGHEAAEKFAEEVGKREKRKIHARRNRDRQSSWFGLGMFGIIGWSVAVPTIIGIMVGVWIDSRWPSRFSWTLMLLLAGVIVGCLNAWYWVVRERGEIEHGEENAEGDKER